MKQITSLNSSAKQFATLNLPTGAQVTFSLVYVPNQMGWFYSFTSGSFTVTNRRLVVSPNMVREFRNIIPFGLACTSSDGYEAIFINDFSTKRINLYLLDQDDVDAAEVLITKTIPEAQRNLLN